jgi:hypothetical protein
LLELLPVHWNLFQNHWNSSFLHYTWTFHNIFQSNAFIRIFYSIWNFLNLLWASPTRLSISETSQEISLMEIQFIESLLLNLMEVTNK